MNEQSIDIVVYLIAIRRRGRAAEQSVHEALTAGRLSELVREARLTATELHTAAEAVTRAVRRGLWIADITDRTSYPERVANAPGAPLVLFGRGASAPLDRRRPTIAIVGSRRASSSSRAFAREIACELARRGALVVSGLAFGVDAEAHEGALESGRAESTVAVVAHGLDIVYPTPHAELAARIIDAGGAVVSEYEPTEPPRRAHFLARNRIVAALADATVVVQAGERSGSLVTVRYAAEYGREVGVVPGPVWDSGFAGSHRLIRDGATLVASVEDVIELLGECVLDKAAAAVRAPLDLSRTQVEILRNLERSTECTEHVLARMPSLAETLHLDLLTLESYGLIARGPGGTVERTGRPWE